ncbi:MAG TPA: ABC transporter substrate binding protein [Steroidobacteraceae bacterium]|nr:ABC transporter substrate binding protein [Steroidobacteraceae bacterium]
MPRPPPRQRLRRKRRPRPFRSYSNRAPTRPSSASSSLNRPGGNATGLTQSNLEVAPKRLECLHELLPAARVMALLVNPNNPAVAETTASQMQAAARTLGLELHVLNASTESDFDVVFAKLSQLRASGLVIQRRGSILRE